MAVDTPWPDVCTLNDVYEDVTTGRARLQALGAACRATWATGPDFVARAPGRVNCIGEHVDYCGYPVMPMAIEHDTLIAVSVVEPEPGQAEGFVPQLWVHNVRPEQWPSRCVAAGAAVEVAREHHWSNYVVAGYKGCMQHLGRDAGARGLRFMVDGRVPIGSGLSSSSALVVAAFVATMRAHRACLDRLEVARLAAEAEVFIGMQSGGMDQAISVLATPGCARIIHFGPLRSQAVALPQGARWVILDSGVAANKYASAASGYNHRVMETRLAAQALARAAGVLEAALGVARDAGAPALQLAHVARAAGWEPGAAEAQARALLPPQALSREEVAALLGLAVEQLDQRHLGSVRVGTAFALQRRALHVYSEAKRVHAFHALCVQQATAASPPLQQWGDLMNASHDSCDRLYDCSCDELNAVTVAAREGGALGARLTGAGWGGWAIALVPEQGLEAFLDHMRAFFQTYTTPMVNPRMYVTQPCAGACIFTSTLCA